MLLGKHVTTWNWSPCRCKMPKLRQFSWRKVNVSKRKGFWQTWFDVKVYFFIIERTFDKTFLKKLLSIFSIYLHHLGGCTRQIRRQIFTLLPCRKSTHRRLHYRSSHSELFLGKGVLKICRKFTGENPCRSAISIKSQSNFVEIVLRHVCSLVDLLHIFITPLQQNTPEWLLLTLANSNVKYIMP